MIKVVGNAAVVYNFSVKKVDRPIVINVIKLMVYLLSNCILMWFSISQRINKSVESI